MTTPDDRAALDELIDRYCDGVIRRDVDTWGSTWTDDASWDLGRGPVEGRDVIVSTWLAAMEGFDWVLQVAPLRIYDADVDSDVATGRVTTTEQFRRSDGTRGQLLATYHDEYRRADDGWRFASRRLEIIDYNVQ